MSDFPEAIDYFVDPERTFVGENDHVAIVCHGTGGSPDQTAQQLGDFFRTTPAETSVHYGIDRAGTICQYVPESAGAGGNGILDPGHDTFWDQFEGDNPNKHTLSFETVNDSTNSLPLTDPQKQTMFKLIAYWVKKYNIPLSNIKGHFTLEPVERKNCPGPNFPWDELFNYLKGNTSMNIPQGWVDDPTNQILKGPNGIPVVLGFRKHVLDPANNWDKDNWPISAERGANPVEQSRASLGPGTVQNFRWKRLEYTAQGGVIEGWLGQELEWYEKAYASQQAQIAALKQEPSIANMQQINTLASQIVQKSTVQ